MSSQNYKNTLNLPKTNFPMKADLAAREPKMAEVWEKECLYDSIHKKSKGKKKYILHDGPPYANGHIHMGHLLNKVLKDIIVKYKTMQGFDAHYVPGWDCHGLPIEHQCLKDMGKRKDQVERVAFRKQARAYAEKFVDIQRKEFKRLGIFGTWEKPYLTMDFSYQAAIAESFLKIYEKNFIEQRFKPVPWCFECETALADAELEYEDRTDKSIYLAFPVEISPRLSGWPTGTFSYLVWTTTPWTLPANVGLAVHPDMDYVFVKSNGKNLIFSKELLPVLSEKLGIHSFKIVHEIKGRGFEHTYAQSPFPKSLEMQKQPFARVIMADYVSSTDGTGIVHIAPGHGEEDYQYGHRKYRLPIVSPVDEKGRFTNEFPPCEGMNVFKANEKIIELLKQKGILLHQEDYTHSYPHCWRCKKPIIFRATPQWFMKIDHESLRKRVLDEIQKKVVFTPDWGKNRIGSMMEVRPDWCLSRQRYWGVPIPVIRCAKCSDQIFVKESKAKIIEIFKNEGADAWFRRLAVDFLPAGLKCLVCGGTDFQKEEDIIDVWFDSGVSHQAVLKKDVELDYPCELYLEGSDQHRGWFQSSIITGIALDGHSPFKSVLTHGFIVDGEGKKMSKSMGNVISPEKMMAAYGADILRLWVASCDYAQDVRLSEEILKHAAQAYVKIRNTFRHLLANLSDFQPHEHSVPYERMLDVDRWAYESVEQLLEEAGKSYDSFSFHEVYRSVYNFAVVKLSSFYFDVTKDVLYTAAKNSLNRRSCQTAFFHILETMVKIIAPIMPFTADEIWRTNLLMEEVKSVHLADWPKKRQAVDLKLLGEWDDLWAVREVVMKVLEESRTQGGIRSPLEARVEIESGSQDFLKFLKRHENSLRFYWVVSQVVLLSGKPDKSDTVSVRLLHADKQVDFSVRVKEAEGKKCERCWNYSVKVGESAEHPTLCERCLEVLTVSLPHP